MRIDAELIDGRFFVKVRLPDATTLRLLADTGGGFTVDPELVTVLPWVAFPDDPSLLGVRLPVTPPVDDESALALLSAPPTDGGGILGAGWFADRVWVFDYVEGRLELVPDRPADPAPIPLAFQVEDGHRTTHFPRIQAVVDDEALDLLLDTGATVALTDAALSELGGPRWRASSFITSSVLAKWRSAHPDWQVIPRASRVNASALICVPTIEVAGVELGPVWFEERADPNFHTYMSQWMDRRIDGALGGNAFAGRRLTIDYPRASAAIV